MGILSTIQERLKNLIGQAKTSAQSFLSQPINPTSTLGRVASGINTANDFLENKMGIFSTVANIPRKYGTDSGNTIASGIRQFQSNTPSTIPFINKQVSGKVAGLGKIGLGVLGLDPLSAYTYEGSKGLGNITFGKDTLGAEGMGLAGALLTPSKKDDVASIGKASKFIDKASKTKKIALSAEEMTNEIKKVVDSEVPYGLKNFAKEVSDKVSPKMAGGINLSRLQLGDVGEEVINQIKPVLEKMKGKTLTHAEVIADANKAPLLEKVISRSETMINEGSMLQSRSKLQALDKTIERAFQTGHNPQGAILSMIEEGKKVSSTATDWARKLESLKIDAGEISTRQKVIMELAKTVEDSKKLAQMASKVDWNDSRQVTNFYRSFVKPTVGEIVTEFRYNNMLSGPKTQARNLLGNLLQTTVLRPAVKLLSGDFTGAGQYYGGLVKAIPEAITDFKNTFTGKIPIESLDLDRITTGSLPHWYGIPTRLTESFDRMFTKMIQGGEIAGGKTLDQASDIAKYTLFRDGFDPKNKTGQGHFLSLIDNYLSGIDTMRNKPLGRFILPFFRTPVQIAKQGLEFSPVGFATVFGTKGVRQKEQLAKAMIGSGISLLTWNLAKEDRVTWAVPTDTKARELFYASGKKPFSVKIGDTWIPMNYLGPLATPMGIASAWKWYSEDAPSSITDSDLEKAGKTLAGVMRIWAQSTPMENVQTALDLLLKENNDVTTGNFFGQMAGSMIPMTGFLRYIAQVTDPLYRKSSGFIGSLKSGLPILSKTLPTYNTPEGTPSKREPINNLLPYDIGIERQGILPYGQMEADRMDQLKQNALNKDVTAKLESGGEVTPEGLNAYLKLDKIVNMPEATDYDKVLKKEAVFSKIDSIVTDEYLTEAQKEDAFKMIGISKQEAQYYSYASKSTEAKTALVGQMLSGLPQEKMMSTLLKLRGEVNNKMILSNSVLDGLETAGVLSEAVVKVLKAVKVANGKVTQTKKLSSGSKKKAPVFKAPKWTGGRKITAPKVGKLRMNSYSPNTFRIPSPKLTIRPSISSTQGTNINQVLRPFSGLKV